MQAELIAAPQLAIQGEGYERVHIYLDSMIVLTSIQGMSKESKLVPEYHHILNIFTENRLVESRWAPIHNEINKRILPTLGR